MGNCFCLSVVKSISPAKTVLSSPGFSAPSNKVAATNGGSDVTNPSGPECDGQILEVPNLKVFTFNELKIATKQFKPQSYLGEGGFGKVYKGWVDEKTLKPIKAGPGALIVAVKKADPESVQGIREWQSEVNFLGSLSHPNLLKLLGYCCEDRELLLVYEFMPKGSLDNHLFGRGAYFQPLSWEMRMKIAIGAAQGLAFLHSLEKQIIYRDFKAANILLDSNFNVKLSDFGLATNGPAAGNSHISTQVKGTYGYAAPEYVATGHLYVKSDVYTFGVVLLEILTGLQALDNNRPSGMQSLVDYAKPFLLDRKKIPGIIDQRLEGRYPSKAAVKAMQLALRCISSDPKARPTMKEVLDNLLEIESTKKSQKSRAQTTRPRVHSHNPTPGRRLPLPTRY